MTVCYIYGTVRLSQPKGTEPNSEVHKDQLDLKALLEFKALKATLDQQDQLDLKVHRVPKGQLEQMDLKETLVLPVPKVV
jgi:hypothetical protein